MVDIKKLYKIMYKRCIKETKEGLRYDHKIDVRSIKSKNGKVQTENIFTTDKIK